MSTGRILIKCSIINSQNNIIINEARRRISHGSSDYRYPDVLAVWVETSSNFQSNHKHRYILCYFERGCHKYSWTHLTIVMYLKLRTISALNVLFLARSVTLTCLDSLL